MKSFLRAVLDRPAARGARRRFGTDHISRAHDSLRGFGVGRRRHRHHRAPGGPAVATRCGDSRSSSRTRTGGAGNLVGAVGRALAARRLHAVRHLRRRADHQPIPVQGAWVSTRTRTSSRSRCWRRRPTSCSSIRAQSQPRPSRNSSTSAKAQPNKLNWGSTNKGSPDHLAGELFSIMTGIPMNHIPYRGAADALLDVLGGRVPLGYFSIPSSLTHVKAGKLVALGVSDTTRSPLLPEVPTISEAGLPGYEMQTWFAVWAPAGTPARRSRKALLRNPDRAAGRSRAEAADRKRLPARRHRRPRSSPSSSRPKPRSTGRSSRPSAWKRTEELAGPSPP